MLESIRDPAAGPNFTDIDHPEWSVGPAADDPDLKFFRENIDTIRKNIENIRNKESAMMLEALNRSTDELGKIEDV